MATFTPAQNRIQTDRFTSDGVTDMFGLTYQPLHTHTVMIDGVHKKVGIVGTHFFFQGYDVLVNERNATINFASPPAATRRRNNIEVIYTYDPAQPTPNPALFPVQSNQLLYAMYPTSLAASPLHKNAVQETKQRQIVSWRESDYLDFEAAIMGDLLITYALCQWLMRQSHGNSGDPFTNDEWQEWYEYAIEHCPRFAREQPKHR
ncbi:MAG: hypothetical protein ABI406_04185 [Ktedonobacteraceae bacterium]